MKRTLAIGDIHGCLAALEHLWRAVDPQPQDRIIFLGDYVDRGPDSKGVIEFILNLPPDLDVTCLIGNHEEKFLLANINKGELAHWLDDWGGGDTLASYGASGFKDVPATHWEFLRKALPYVETDSHIFVHANLEADVPLALQQSFTLLHKKFGKPKPHQSGKTMVCGHTALKAPHLPINLGHAVCIDTDPGRGGWLTCLDTESGKYWQVTNDGEGRAGAI